VRKNSVSSNPVVSLVAKDWGLLNKRGIRVLSGERKAIVT
jgi:hypothetical protein